MREGPVRLRAGAEDNDLSERVRAVSDAGPMSKGDIAEGFAALAAPVIAERGKAPIRAGKGRSRPVFTVAPSGEVTGIVPHSAVLQGLLVRQGIADAVVEGKRPERILCADCKGIVKVHPGGGVIPTKCKKCSGKVCDACGASSAQGKPMKFGLCGSCVRARAAAKFVCPRCGGPKASKRGASCHACAARDKRIDRPPPTCVDCGTGTSSHSASRCKSCMAKQREANRSPEYKVALANRARYQLTPEQRMTLARSGGLASAKAKAAQAST